MLGYVGETTSLAPNRPGRPPLFTAQKRITRDLHVRVESDEWDAVKSYCQAIGGASVNFGFRRLVRDRLIELGFLKEKVV